MADVQVLKDLKEKYKKSTGREYVAPGAGNTSGSSKDRSKEKKTNMAPTPVSNTAVENLSPEAEAIVKRITEQGDKIRVMKSEKAAKVFIMESSFEIRYKRYF